MDGNSTPPASLGKYQVRGVLGRGAMGTVYDGWDPVIGRRVAVKTVRLLGSDDPEAQEGLARFKREAQAAGRLSHPNIVGVYDYGETNEAAYIVMEFIEGQSLKERLDTREPFPVGETVRIMEQVLAALQFSHQRAVIHRDIKPGNVMLAEGGGVKLADFGIARIESSVMTQDGTMLGTPAYMSPEQLMAQSVDARSDIYSAGVLLYQMLTGERPFEGSLTTIIHKALNTVPPRPSEISVTAPPSLDPVVARAMSKRPDDRYPDATSFARALRAAYEAREAALPDLRSAGSDDATTITHASRPAAKRPTEPPPAAGSRRLSPAMLGSAAGALLVLIGGGTWLTLHYATQHSANVPATIAGSGVSTPPAEPSPPPAKPLPQASTTSPPGTAAPAGSTSAPTSSPPATGDTPPPPASSATPPVTAGDTGQTKPSTTASPVLPSPQPTPASTGAPVAPPSPPPTQVAVAPLDPAAIRAALENVALSARCALPQFSVSEDGRVNASGLVGAGAPETALRDAVQQAAPGALLTGFAQPVNGPYCEVLDLLRPIAQKSSPFLSLKMKDDVTHLRDKQDFQPLVTMPEFPAYLRVDYLSSDGSVGPLYPLRGGEKPAPANSTIALTTRQVGPPFGTDMIVAIASSAPLSWRGETIETYLAGLKAALDAAKRQHTKLTGRALTLEISP